MAGNAPSIVSPDESYVARLGKTLKFFDPIKAIGVRYGLLQWLDLAVIADHPVSANRVSLDQGGQMRIARPILGSTPTALTGYDPK